jgi:ATP-dependent RNA helicase RhlE
VSLHSFDTLGLRPEYLRAVADQGYTEPTPVQQEAIPLVLAGRDLLAGAQTGTGKTAAFVLPLLQRLHETRGPGLRRVRALIVVPTRELALQVNESVRVYGAQRPIRSVPIYGGVGFDKQMRELRAGAEIVVATPGRLLDHVNQKTIDLRSVEILVLDEADRMLDMGFIHDVRKILALLPTARQSLLFSATFSGEIRTLASGMLNDPASVQVTPRNTAPELVSQLVIPVDRERKRELLSHLVRTRRIDQALVFTRTKHGANRLAEQLDKDGIAAAAIHGNKSQPQRVRALNDFKQGRVLVLVATDIAARGIDIDSLPHVVNFELPTVPEDYVHRIGRTGRAGVDGIAISLVCVDEARLLRDIESLVRHPIDKEVIRGFEPDPSIRPEPIKLRSGMGRPQAQRPQGFRPSAPRSPGFRPQGAPFQGQRPQGPRPVAAHPAARPAPGYEPRYEERFQPRPEPRPDASPDQRVHARPAARYDAGTNGPRPERGFDPRAAGARPDRGFDARSNGPRQEHRSEPRPHARPTASIGNRPPAAGSDFRNTARRPRPSDWRTGPREGRATG